MEPVAKSQPLYRWQSPATAAEEAADPSIRQLRESLLQGEAASHRQPAETRSLLQEQGGRIGAALLTRSGELEFRLPPVVVAPEGDPPLEVPADFQAQRVAGLWKRAAGRDVRTAFRSRLSQLDLSGYLAVRIASGLLRHAAARAVVDELVSPAALPAAPDSEPAGMEVPSVRRPVEPPAPERIRESEEAVRRLREALTGLQQAVSLSPCFIADETYQLKRNVLTGRLAAHGHTLAHLQLCRIAGKIIGRSSRRDLDRGLALSLPFFNDRTLDMDLYDFEVIPAGRTMFVPAFVALAARREQEKVERADSLTPSTRMHLLAALQCLERAFDDRPE
jgi:hypothetical protein